MGLDNAMTNDNLSLESIADSAIDRWYHIFKAFDVVDGDTSISDYFNDVINFRKTKQKDSKCN